MVNTTELLDVLDPNIANNAASSHVMFVTTDFHTISPKFNSVSHLNLVAATTCSS